MEQRFEEKWGFPGVLDAIDGCHFLVKGPRKNQKQYINHKGFHSPQFADVFCGYPGSVCDARVFRNSPFFQDAEANPDVVFPRNTHVIGDCIPCKGVCANPFSRQWASHQERKMI